MFVMVCAAARLVQAQDADPPGRAARLSDAEGAVSLQPAGAQDWTYATPNRPLTTGDRLWSDEGARAELDLGTAAVRLGSYTGFAFLDLDDRSVQMQLSAGTLIVSIRDILNGEHYEVDTPNTALSLLRPGVYRVEVNDQGTTTTVAVSQGVAQAAGSGQTVAISSQQLVTFSGSDDSVAQLATLGAPDEFDEWAAERDRAAAQSASMDYLASDVPGGQDLDDNGQWQQTAEYGYVWVPTVVAVDWAPYRYGRWVWIGPWGWTWVDDARWGYAPFHYGRWVVWNQRWSWVPAPRHGRTVRVVYAPALVAWIGRSPAGTRGLGDNVAWFPLGPREVYVPAYRASLGYVRNVNATNTARVNGVSIGNPDNAHPHYVNETPGAVTAVPRSTLLSGQRVAGHSVAVSAPMLAAAVVAATPALIPTPQSVIGVASGRNVARPPASLMQRSLVARTAPPSAPVPIERQLSVIEANGGLPPTRSELARLQHAAALTPMRVVSGRGATAQFPAASAGASRQSLAERERTLQQSALPSAARSGAPPTPAAPEMVYAPGESLTAPPPLPRTDRPPTAQQHPVQPYQPASATDDASLASERASSERASIPVYHLPAVAAQPAGQVPPVHALQTYRPPVTNGSHAVTPPPAVPAERPPVPAPATAREPSNKEPRDSAPHGDRDSRERVLR